MRYFAHAACEMYHEIKIALLIVVVTYETIKNI